MGERLELAEILADDTSVHVFRHQVAEQLRFDWPQRANGLKACGEAGVQLVCTDCECQHLAPYRCNARCCPTCAKIAAALIVERTARRVEWAMKELSAATRWDGEGPAHTKRWKMLTVTQQTAGDYGSSERYQYRALRRSLERTRRGWGYFWRMTPWGALHRVRSDVTGRWTERTRTDTCFVFGLEVAPGGMVHGHAAIFGEYVPDRLVREWWETAIAWPGFIKLKAMKHGGDVDLADALREVLKYPTKGEPGGELRAERAALLELAMKRLRRVEVGGVIRKAPKVDRTHLVYDGQKSCLECGAVNHWRWRRIQSPAYVAANGGFGLDRWDDITAVPETMPALRASLYEAHFSKSAPEFMYEEMQDTPAAAAGVGGNPFSGE